LAGDRSRTFEVGKVNTACCEVGNRHIEVAVEGYIVFLEVAAGESPVHHRIYEYQGAEPRRMVEGAVSSCWGSWIVEAVERAGGKVSIYGNDIQVISTETAGMDVT
jgi:hypothetical protein